MEAQRKTAINDGSYYEGGYIFHGLDDKVGLLEAAGWRTWLMKLFPFWFRADFSDEHIAFWDLRWSVLHRYKRQQEEDRKHEFRTDDDKVDHYKKLGIYVSAKEATVFEFWGRGLAKCLDGDTLVTLTCGARKTIRDVEIGQQIVSYNEATGRMEPDTISNKWASGVKPCVTVTTKSNKTLTLTKDHKVLTFDGWKRAGDLTLNDRIASPRRVPVFVGGANRTDEEVRLLAYFLAEGNTTISLRVGGGTCLSARITNADAPIVEDAIACAVSLGFKGKKGTKYTVNFSGGIREWIRENGLAGKSALEKRIPGWVYQLPDEQKWQFISAFIDTDGWIGQNGKIGITLANEPLVLDLQTLLLQVGVPSVVRMRPNNHANAWALHFDQEGVNRNADRIRLRVKCEKLEKHLSVQRYSLIDTYPYRAVRGLPKGVGNFFKQRGLSLSKRYDVTRRKLRDALVMYSYALWEKLESSEVFWDKVVSIDEAGEHETFDIEVSKNHNFISNNLISHNSATIEAARVMYGAILGSGYSLMVSETDDQAQEHLGNCRILIEHPDSRLLEYYPEMAITETADALKGMPTADRKEMFICKNGYIVRAKGLSAKMRGLRVGNQRPTEIAFDDLDDVSDSLMVSLSKETLVTASILPVLDKQRLIVDFGQNLITEHSFATRLYKGTTDALAERTVLGVTNAFTKLDLESYIDETGKIRHRILPTSIPSWAGLNIDTAQRFLNNSGLQTFKAEYQNEFDQFKAGRVIPEFGDHQIISWSEFEAVFGEKKIPSHWIKKAGLDVGYSEGKHPHYSAWDFFTTSAMNSPYPGLVFCYRSRSFLGLSIDDQAERIKGDMWSDEYVTTWQMSHEKTGEMMTLNQRHGFHFTKFQYYRAEEGVAQWRHLSRIDEKRFNPFTGKEGSPTLFYIVDDDQKQIPVNDGGMKLLREQVPTWEYVAVKLTENGQTQQKPSKVNDDHCDVNKGILALFEPPSKGLTRAEAIEEKLEAKGLGLKQIADMESEDEKITIIQQRLQQPEISPKVKSHYPRVAANVGGLRRGRKV